MEETPLYFDIHSHLNFPKYDEDREDVIARMNEGRVWTVTVGTDIESSESGVELAGKHEGIFATVGIHPDGDPSEWDEGLFSKLLQDKRVVGVGECGLDVVSPGETTEEAIKNQRELFEKHIELAVKHNKPLMIHCRNAYSDVYDILAHYSKSYGDKLRGDMHFFAGDTDMARKFLDLGFYLSFTGVITFAESYHDVVRFAPLERIMAETDAPFVSPVPYRGKRNEPLFVSEVVRHIAKLKNEDFDFVRESLVKNALEFFGVSAT